MKLWTRLMVGGLALMLALNLSVGSADAASKKKKKKEVVKEKKETSRPKKRYVSGTNLWGRSGLLLGDTSEVAAVGQVEGSVHLTYQSLASASYGAYSISSSNIGIPFGAHFGIAKNLELSASGNLLINSYSSNVPGATGTSSSIFAITAGGKYRIAGENRNAPDFSVGADIMVPTNAGGQVVFTPKGTISYVLESGMLLNGEMGIGISTTTYVMADAGVAFPFSDKFSGIAEIGANQYGYLGSMLALGARAGLSSGMALQALLGVPLNGGGVMIGAGISLASK